MRGKGRVLSDYHVVLCKVRLVEAWIKRRKVVVGARRFRSEKLKEHQYRERSARFLEEKVEGRRMVEFFKERGLCVGNTYFKHRIFHKYTRVARG